MRKALQYIRISDEDQSNFSLEGQDRYNQAFAERNQIHIVETYVDNGVSAKNFNRPQWKRLEQRLKTDKSIDVLIIMKYDRLIRNVFLALEFLDRAEREYGVVILSSMENFSMDVNSPMFFKIRADMLVAGEFERRTISERTKFGIVESRKQGYYLNKAPIGYLNGRDAKGKACLLVDPKTAKWIQYIFRSYIAGIAIVDILAVVNLQPDINLNMKRMNKLLANPIYASIITVPAFKGQPSYVTTANHEPLITKDEFYQAQAILDTKKHRTIPTDDLPLRGYLQCEQCGEIFSGSKSKGRNAYYHYYRCFTCTKTNYNQKHVHATLTDILASLSPSQKLLDSVEAKVIAHYTTMEGDKKQMIATTRKRITELQTKIDGLEEKYIDGNITTEVYHKYNIKFAIEKKGLQSDLDRFSSSHASKATAITDNLRHLLDLPHIWQYATTAEKKQLCTLLFGRMAYSNRHFRTTFLHPLLHTNRLDINTLTVDSGMKKGTSVIEVPVSSPHSPSLEPLLKLISNIAS